MSNQWTGEQLEAIESRGRNLLVAAAAGAGKLPCWWSGLCE